MHTAIAQTVEHSPEPIVTSVRTIYMYAVLCAKTQKQGLRVCIFYNTIKYSIRIFQIQIILKTYIPVYSTLYD